MSNAQPGYYADPYGDASKLRYWDGTQWTTACIDNPQAAMPVAQPPASQAAAPVQQPTPVTQAAADPVAAPAQAIAPQPSAAGVAEPAQPDAGTAVPYATAQPPVVPAPPQAQPASYAAKPANGTDTTLRLVAFVFMLVSLISICIATVLFLPYVIMLAWVIPMTVHSWGIYKGTKRNTVAFGVCSLLFASIVSGILLLVAKKDA